MSSFNVNNVVLGGFLAADPECKDLPKGDVMSRFRLGVDQNGGGDDPMFIQVAAFGKQAEACGEYLHKGSPAVVEGQLRQSRWETKDGDKRTAFSIKAFRVHFGPKPKE